MRRAGLFLIPAVVSLAYLGCSALGLRSDEKGLLMPEVDLTRTERLEVMGSRFFTPEGFTVEQVATDELVGSVVNMTFDHLGRPALSREGGGILLLIDEDGDGKYDSVKEYSTEIETAHGMHYIGAGDLLVNSEGPERTGLYRLTDTDGDDKADKVTLIANSRGRIQEHGPHTILTGPDGYHYILYGNHAFPRVELDPASPSRGLQEDHLLPRFVDPRGHANSIRAPGGTIHRLDPELKEWSQIVAGYRNPFDMAADIQGELFPFDADMEWDFGLPWYRPIRVVHAVPGGDFGWRTGSSKNPFYNIDTLPSVDNAGRGSPVGVAFYYHNAYPKQYYGALFLGDWARGRIRVIFPKQAGATYEGRIVDFVLGEPLNVTDMDIGPDGSLYFSTGGRGTTGGLYRVRYTGRVRKSEPKGIAKVLDQPMPRSAWGREAILKAKAGMGDAWERELQAAVKSRRRSSDQRLRALEALQVLGPKPDLDFLTQLTSFRDSRVRSAAIFLLGTFPYEEVGEVLTEALTDRDPFTVRRACEALVRAGLNEGVPLEVDDALPVELFELIDHEDRFVRYAARLALMRVDQDAWVARVTGDDIEERPRGALEGVLALIYTQGSTIDANTILSKLDEYGRREMDEETLLDYARAVQLALIRHPSGERSASARQEFIASVGPRLLERFPTADARVNRELQVVLAAMQTPGAIEPILKYLHTQESQQEQIHTVYALRAIEKGWTPDTRKELVDWFDLGWQYRGAASMSGYINNLWEATLALLTEDERTAAEARRESALAERARRAAELMADVEGDNPPAQSDLAQMSFEELGDYLEYDIMTYERGNADRGRRVFYRSKCVDCHVFGTEGRGGGPDLSTVVKRFRRRDILESIMYPSKVISDQYTALRVELDNNDTLNGMFAGEDETTLTLIDATGGRIDIAKSTITDRRTSDVSIMPEGLLDVMSLQELVDLILFLERGAEE